MLVTMHFRSFFYGVCCAGLLSFIAACSEDSGSSHDPELQLSSPFVSISAMDGADLIEGRVDAALRQVSFSFESEAVLDSVVLSFTLKEF